MRFLADPILAALRARSIPAPVLAGLTAGLLGSILAGAGCYTTPEPPQKNVEVLYPGTLEQAQPRDVVVAPLRNTSGEAQVPDEALREAFVRALVKRRYSPLALEYVDRQVVEAAYSPGSLAEDAVLQVEVRRWDTSRFKSHGTVVIELEAWMLDATGRAELWGGSLSRTFELTGEANKYSTTTALFQSICEELAQELLEAMPARTPAP